MNESQLPTYSFLTTDTKHHGAECNGIRRQKRYLTITVPYGFCGDPDAPDIDDAGEAVVYEVRVRGVQKWRGAAMRGEWSDFVRTSYTCQLAQDGKGDMCRSIISVARVGAAKDWELSEARHDPETGPL